MPLNVKICGISDQTGLLAAIDSGANYVGFVFYPRSPRAITIPQATALSQNIPTSVQSVQIVGLFVNPDDSLLEETLRQVPLSMIQLHGSESPERVAEIRTRFQKPVMKALPISARDDLMQIARYESVADWLLFDAKPPKDGLPGGNAISFDWTLLQGIKLKKPWMLAGGINAGNVVEAKRLSGATCVDVSSGVEESPGKKSPEKIREFLAITSQL